MFDSCSSTSLARLVMYVFLRIFVSRTIWVPISRYELFHKTGKLASKQRPVITSSIYRTFVDEETAGYDIKDDLMREIYVKVTSEKERERERSIVKWIYKSNYADIWMMYVKVHRSFVLPKLFILFIFLTMARMIFSHNRRLWMFQGFSHIDLSSTCHAFPYCEMVIKTWCHPINE